MAVRQGSRHHPLFSRVVRSLPRAFLSVHGLKITRRLLICSKRISDLEEAIRIKNVVYESPYSFKQRERELRASPTAKRRLPVPDHIPKPPYVSLELVPDISSQHQIHDSEGIARMRAACELAARVRDYAGTLVRGYHGDTSKTFLCGNVNYPMQWLVKVTEECLQKGITHCKDGALFRKIGKRISEHAEKYGFGVVDGFAGHGIGTVFHSEPLIYHHQ